MPRLSTGDVFETIGSSRVQFAIVFGHIGFNEMQQRWTEFSVRRPQLADIRDPFTQTPNRPVALADGTWLWFVPEQENHGMAEEPLRTALDDALSWAAEQGIVSAATNGISNTDHGRDTTHNRQSDDQRARFLINYSTAAENRHGITIELVSLNDVFLRNHP